MRRGDGRPFPPDSSGHRWWPEFGTADVPHYGNCYTRWNLMGNTGAAGLNWFRMLDGSYWEGFRYNDLWCSRKCSGYAWRLLDINADIDVAANDSTGY